MSKTLSLPSKKIIFILGACIVVVAGISFVVKQKNGPGNQLADTGKVAQLAIDEEALRKIGEIDQDNDGLSDWEEFLWKTNPKNPDSDGDGTPDGKEVELGRNPALAGPNDTMRTETALQKKEAFGVEKLTETDKLARNLFAEYMALKQKGVPIDPGMQSQIIQHSINSSYGSFSPKKHTLAELNVVSDESELAVRNYGNEMGRILKVHTPPNAENEIVILDRALKTENEAEILKLDPIIIGYSNIIRDSLALKVPRSVSSAHLSLINSMEEVLESIKSMRIVFNDPITSLPGIGEYLNSGQKLAQSFKNIQGYFKSHNITFNISENGYVFAM